MRLAVLKHHGHGCTLVQNPQLSLRTLLVRGIGEDAAVQQRSVRVRNHGSDIPRAVRLATLFLWELQAVDILLDGLLPV